MSSTAGDQNPKHGLERHDGASTGLLSGISAGRSRGETNTVEEEAVSTATLRGAGTCVSRS